MNGIIGTWHLRMKTPIGTIDADYEFTETGTGTNGTASAAGETVPVDDLAREPVPGGERVTWTQRITKPLRLNLAFEVTVAGDRLTGTSRAGRLPRTEVTGERRGA
ncbi:hypothetical protein [Glycomyces xiaoerkulensis]|uniref:hypothetical protein n=1 Tax=Glycomyces xiaoerkulensis TaxID=2038139 RepID=UPI000C258EA5|nr:hypothetical protein [Glycomyces xiaoerkulensis]